MKGLAGLILLGLILAGLWFLHSSGAIEKFFKTIEIKSKGGYFYTESAKKTLEDLKKVYESFHRTLDIIANPEKVYLSAQESKPGKDVLRNEYKIKVGSKAISRYLPYEIIEENNKLNINFQDAIVMYRLEARVKNPLKINYFCIFKSSIPECIQVAGGKSGEVFIRDITIKPIICSGKIKYLKYNLSKKNCRDYLDYGFYIDSILMLIFNLSTYTIYRALIVNNKVLENAMIEEKDIYEYLGLSKDYDIGIYYGIPGYPKINIDRLNRKSGFPMIYFGNKISDIIIVELKPISNIMNINRFIIKFYPKDYVKFLDYNGECVSSAIYNYGYFNLICENGECKMVNIKYWNYYKENNYKLSLFIPVCIDKDIKEYADLIINASVDYTYAIGYSERIYYRKI